MTSYRGAGTVKLADSRGTLLQGALRQQPRMAVRLYGDAGRAGGTPAAKAVRPREPEAGDQSESAVRHRLAVSLFGAFP